jgi:renalase
MQIAIIGAGLSGLTCARALQARGHQVTVFEKSGGVSGRISTRRTEFGGFDHGAQYFTVTTKKFRSEADHWIKAGWIAPWQGKLVTLDNGKVAQATKSSAAKTRYVGVPGMRNIGEQLSHGIDVRVGQRVERIERFDKQWVLMVHADTVPIAATAGPFDAVIVAVPADQAEPLLSADPAFSAQAQTAKLVPCWTLMLAFQQPLNLGFDGAWVSGSRLGWIAQDASKPGRRPGEHWVCNATSAWSIEHLEDDPERAKEKLLKAFHQATGTQVQPVHAAVHRWRYAQAAQPLEGDCLWNAQLLLGACGDWFAAGLAGAGRIENAFLSGTALATLIS